MPYVRTVKELEDIMALTEDIETNEIQHRHLEALIIKVTGKYSKHHVEAVFDGLQRCRFIEGNGSGTYSILKRSFNELPHYPKAKPEATQPVTHLHST